MHFLCLVLFFWLFAFYNRYTNYNNSFLFFVFFFGKFIKKIVWDFCFFFTLFFKWHKTIEINDIKNFICFPIFVCVFIWFFFVLKKRKHYSVFSALFYYILYFFLFYFQYLVYFFVFACEKIKLNEKETKKKKQNEFFVLELLFSLIFCWFVFFFCSSVSLFSLANFFFHFEYFKLPFFYNVENKNECLVL